MKRRTMALYKEWGRLDSVIDGRSTGKQRNSAIARKRRIGEILIRERQQEDRVLKKLEQAIRKL